MIAISKVWRRSFGILRLNRRRWSAASDRNCHPGCLAEPSCARKCRNLRSGLLRHPGWSSASLPPSHAPSHQDDIGRDFPYALLRAVAGMDDTPLQAALDRLADADILLVQGLPPDADYRFKHALIQDAAYENLLKSRRQVLHRRVGETLRDKFAGTVNTEPELLAHHFTQAGMTETAIEWWGKAGQRSLERSALVEAIAQLTRALDQIATLPATPALRRERIKIQVALINPLMHVKGYGAPEIKAAVERARLLIEQAETLGEPPEDPCCRSQFCSRSGPQTISPSMAPS